MRRISVFIAAAAIFLAACSSQTATQTLPPTAAPTQVEATAAATPTLEPTSTQPAATETTAPTEEPPASSAPASDVRVYVIVPGESQLQYEVGEVFINDNNRFAVAIGVTPQIEGEILVDRSAPQNSTIGTVTADVSQFKSDSGRRDNAIRGRFLESQRYPMVTFVPTQIEGLPESYQEGQDIQLKITGDLTIREMTRPVTFDATVRLEGDLLTGQAITTILMSDYEFGPISLAGILKTEDEARVTLTFIARS